MSAVVLIAQRELLSFFKGTMGWVVVAALLLLDGLLFHGMAMGTGEHLSSEVLRAFFHFSFGVTAAAGVLLAMRVLAAEVKDGTAVLLYTAPVGDWQIVLGKWLAAFSFVLLLVALTFYLPWMISIHGTVQSGHVMAGYLGLGLVGAASTAIGTFCSSLTRHQLVAGVLGGVLVISFVVMWMISKVASPPIDGVLSYLSMYDKHFLPFSKGTIQLRDVVFFGSVTFFFLLGARVVLGARRWR
jgi:ABC-2 type transport system permease protein